MKGKESFVRKKRTGEVSQAKDKKDAEMSGCERMLQAAAPHPSFTADQILLRLHLLPNLSILLSVSLLPDPLPDLHILRHKEKLATLKNETLLWVPDRSETEGKGMERCWKQELQPVTIFLHWR